MKRRPALRAVGAARARPTRVFAYARVSSQEQALGTSLEDQQRAIAAYAASLGLEVTRYFVEAESALQEKAERREQMRALMAEVRVGDLVLCDKVDRWSRDPGFAHTSIRQILECGASFYAVGDQCDPSTHEGDLMLGFRVVLAREEAKRIKLRTVGTRKLLRDRGFYAEGLPPFGYRRALRKGERAPETKNVLVIDEQRADLVRRAFHLCVAGGSLSQIAAAVGLPKDRVGRMLRARVYVGELQDSRGAWIKGRHPALVDVDIFARAQTALDARRLGGARPRAVLAETSSWILRDVAVCALCGARMGAAYAGTPNARRYYYRCSHACTTRYVRVERIEADAEPMIVARLEELRDELAREPERTLARVIPHDIAERRARLAKKRERFLEAFADGHMTRDELRERMAKLDAEVLQLDGLEAAERRPSPLADARVRRSALAEIGAIRRAWESAAPEAKRAIVGQLATAVRLAAGAPPVFVWRSVEELAERI